MRRFLLLLGIATMLACSDSGSPPPTTARGPESSVPPASGSQGVAPRNAASESAVSESAASEHSAVEGTDTEGADTEGADAEGADTEGADTEGAAQQEDDVVVARHRTAVAASPDDAQLRCRLAFALVRADRFAEARDSADSAVESLRGAARANGREGREARRLLGACLYNRGRANEGLSSTTAAKRDYVASLAARMNDAVLARLVSLGPGAVEPAERDDCDEDDCDEDNRVPVIDPSVVLAAAEVGSTEPLELVDAPTVVEVGGNQWSLVTLRHITHRGILNVALYAVVQACGGLHVAPVDSWHSDDHSAGFLDITEQSSLSFGGAHALVVHTEGSGDVTCGMDGMSETEHRAVSVAFMDGCELRVRNFETFVNDCGQVGSMSVRFRGGDAIISDVRGGDTSRAGRYPLR